MKSFDRIAIKEKTSIVEHLQLALVVVAGIVALALACRSKDSLSASLRACYLAYGVAFLMGSLAYYTKPRIGSTILMVSLLSSIVVAPLVGFPVWVNGSTAERAGLVLGAVISAGIVSAPLLRAHDKRGA